MVGLCKTQVERWTSISKVRVQISCKSHVFHVHIKTVLGFILCKISDDGFGIKSPQFSENLNYSVTMPEHDSNCELSISDSGLRRKGKFFTL